MLVWRRSTDAVTTSSQAAPAPVASAPASAPTLPPVAPSPYDFGEVSSLINDAIAANELPGAVVLIGQGGRVVFRQAYGERKLASEPGLDGLPAPAELKDPWGLDGIDRAEGFRRALTTPLESSPGVRFRYSDINFILLGLLIEKLTGEAEDDYVQQNVFAPLRMTDTRYLPAAKACGPHSMRGAAVAWTPASAEGGAGQLPDRHVEYQPVVAHRADGTGRREQSGSRRESRYRLPAVGHGE